MHDLTTQSPFEVWLAIPNKARAPKMDYPPLRIVRFSGAVLTDGIEEHQIDGVTNVARTVADCFKFRNKKRGRPTRSRCSPHNAGGSTARSNRVM